MSDFEKSKSLVESLRYLGDHASYEPHMYHKAADEIERLRAALEPFAKAANDFDDFTNKQPDGWNIYSGENSSYNYISVGHLRRAREVWEKVHLDD